MSLAWRIVVTVYLVLAVASFVIAITADDPLASIYLFLFALPWGMLVTSLLDRVGANIAVLNYAVMLAGIGLTALLLTSAGRWRYRRRVRGKPESRQSAA